MSAIAIDTHAAMQIAFTGGADTTGLIWSNAGTKGGVQWFLPPTTGTGENQVDGTKYNMKYAELTFGLSPDVAVVPAEHGDYLRIILIKERQPPQDITGAGLGWSVILNSNNFFSPVDTKRWDCQYDKIFPFTTGLVGNAAIGTPYVQSQMAHSKRFRFIIPLKKTMTVSTEDYQFPNRMYMYAWTLHTSQFWKMEDTTVVYRFTE